MLDIRYNYFVKSEEQIREDWYNFGNGKFVEFRGSTRKTISDFANYVGISQPLMSQELKKGGSVPRDQKTITAWVNRYGFIVYEILDLPVPNDSLDSLPEPVRSIAQEVRETIAEYKVSGDSPEAAAIVDEIMKKHGYKLTSTED